MSDPQKEQQGGHRRKRKSKRLDLNPHQRAARILSDLREMAKTIGEQQGVSHLEPFPFEELLLPIRTRIHPTSSHNDDVDKLVATMTAHIREAIVGISSFQLGAVFCFLCERPDCVHAAPSDKRETFAGYTPTGKPKWVAFTNLLIEQQEPRVDRLYDEHPEVIAIHQSAADLKHELLPGFGRGSVRYNLLGQTIAGLIPSDLDTFHHDTNRVALTFQAVETRFGHEPPLLRFNLIGITPMEIAEAAARGGERSPGEQLQRSLRISRQRLDSLSRRYQRASSRGRMMDLEIEVEPILTRLKGELDRIFNPYRHRTQHAHRRHKESTRPTSSALQDASNASSEHLLHDGRNNTVVVLGPRGRAHVFSLDGRHITSLQLRKGELKRKMDQSRWQPLSPARETAFRQSLARSPQSD